MPTDKRTIDPVPPERIDTVIDLARAAGARHRESLMALRGALIAGEDADRIVTLAREACGLEQTDCRPPGSANKKLRRKPHPQNKSSAR